MDLTLLRVENSKHEHAVQHLRRLLSSEALVEVDNDLTVAVRLELEFVMVSKREGVVDLSVKEQPDVGIGEHAKGLHPVDLVCDGEAVEAEASVGNLSHRLNTSGVRTAVGDLEEVEAVLPYIFLGQTEQRPYTAHDVGSRRYLFFLTVNGVSRQKMGRGPLCLYTL